MKTLDHLYDFLAYLSTLEPPPRRNCPWRDEPIRTDEEHLAYDLSRYIRDLMEKPDWQAKLTLAVKTTKKRKRKWFLFWLEEEYSRGCALWHKHQAQRRQRPAASYRSVLPGRDHEPVTVEDLEDIGAQVEELRERLFK